MRRPTAVLLALAAFLVAAPASAQAAKTYNDPWLEGDLEQLRVPEALDMLARTPQHVIVGDVDSGARLTDPDLMPHLLQMSSPYTCSSEYGPGPTYSADPANGDFGCDFIGTGDEDTPSTNPDGDPTDPFGHGTGTAEIIGGAVNNGTEGAGVAPNARVLPIRACYGGNPDCYNEPAADGLQYAVDMGAKVVNESWPPEDLSTAELGILHDNPGVLFVFAIGGTGQNDEPYPACTDDADYPNVICVGLANKDDSAGTTDAQMSTDVSAPGYGGVPNANGTRREFGYTSGATAHVTGAAALLRGLAPDLTPKQIRDVLVTTSRHVDGYETANMADGIVDVEAAVKQVQSMEGFTTPAEGHGAPVDSPDPFAGQVSTTTTTTTTTPVTTTTTTHPVTTTPPPTSTGTYTGVTVTTGGVTTTPPPTSPSTTDTTPTPPPPLPPPAPTLMLLKLAKSVRAGKTLTVSVQVTDGPATVTATLKHGKKTLAKAKRTGASGSFRLSLRLSKKSKAGKATLTVRIGTAAPTTRTITVKRR